MKRTVNLGEISGGRLKMNLGYFSKRENAKIQNQGHRDNQEENQGEQKESKTYIKEELDAILQSETDKRVNQALNSFKTKELPKLLSVAKAEAEKLTELKAQEKAAHEFKQKEELLSRRESEVIRKELKIEAYKIFMEKGLPMDLLDVVLYDSAESRDKSIDAVEKAFRQAVEKGINERLKGQIPKYQLDSWIYRDSEPFNYTKFLPAKPFLCLVFKQN